MFMDTPSRRLASVIENLVVPLKERVYTFERNLFSVGYKQVIGIAIAGREAIFGPLVCSGVILSSRYKPMVKEILNLSLKDFKSLPYSLINAHSQISSIMDVSQLREINNINKAENKLRIETLIKLAQKFEINKSIVITNYSFLPSLPSPYHDSLGINRGHKYVYVLKLAQFIALTTWRNHILDIMFKNPGWERYGLKINFGNDSKLHREAIQEFGLTPQHRKKLN